MNLLHSFSMSWQLCFLINHGVMLGIIFGDKLSFKEHVTILRKNTNQKLYALSRISIFMDTEKLIKIL